jgi:hypothetical protein
MKLHFSKKKKQIDILLISETHFTSKNHFSIPGYELCCTNHTDGTAHGGTAIIIKNTITYYEQLKYAEEAIQATSIKVKVLLYEITVAAVYCPPRHNLKQEHFEIFFHSLGPKFLAGGDYNSEHIQWGSRLTTTKGKAIPLQAWSGPEGSRKLRFPDFMTTAQDGGNVVSLTHRPPLPPENTPGTHFC